MLVSFFQRRDTDPERFHQFPQRINRLSRDEETCNSFTDVSSTQEGKNTPRVNDCLNTNPAKEDYAQVSYTNLTFEASGSMEREATKKLGVLELCNSINVTCETSQYYSNFIIVYLPFK